MAERNPNAEIGFRWKIYSLLQQRIDPMTDRQIMYSLQETDFNNIRPEITRLRDDGIIRECGKARCEHTGKSVRTVQLTGLPYFKRQGKSRKFAHDIPKIQTELF